MPLSHRISNKFHRVFAGAHRTLDALLSRGKPAWYRGLPPTFNWSDGHPEFRKGKFKKAFKKYSRSREYVDKKLLTLPYLREHGIQLSLFGGLGDSIQFLRFAKLLHENGVRVTLVFDAKYRPLKELFSMQSYITSVVDMAIPDVPAINLKSVPHLLDIDLKTLPVDEYLIADPALVRRYADMMKADGNLKIGVQLTGGKIHDVKKRYVDISMFRSLSEKQVSLYYLDRDNLLDTKGVPLHQLGENRTFPETAAILQNMDLVISVDTAAAHLAGAMHRPVWTLLPHPCPSWRYFLDESRMPWYPTMRIFRQSERRDWEEVMAHVDRELTKIMDNR